MIRIKLTRDSVCAGDDIDAPHERIVEVYSFTDTHSFVNQFATGYLPSVNGYGHSWTAYLNGNPIANNYENRTESVRDSIRRRERAVFQIPLCEVLSHSWLNSPLVR
jgi:hypothetical protein